jgi:DNA-binding response OmpR family regulator
MTTRQKVLLVDDEQGIPRIMVPFLERAGFTVAVASNGKEALEKVRTFAPDLIILDIIMPMMDGREVLRHLRQAGDWTPIILLTQVGEATERAMALEEGADDYLNKPFDPHELIARVHAVLRRVNPDTPSLASSQWLVSGDLRLQRGSRRAYLGEQELQLTPKAMRVLEYLIGHPNELISRERLLDVVWGWDEVVGTRVVDFRIAELRRVLKDDPAHPRYIETVSGQGYRFLGTVERKR